MGLHPLESPRVYDAIEVIYRVRGKGVDLKDVERPLSSLVLATARPSSCLVRLPASRAGMRSRK